MTFSIGAQGDMDNGHVNVLMQMEKAAKLAELASPTKPGLVTVTVFDGTVSKLCPQSQFDSPDNINVGQANGVDAQWEADVMHHEYGHFVLERVAPGGPSGGDHKLDLSYPDMPDTGLDRGALAMRSRPQSATITESFSGVVLLAGKP